MPANYPVYTPAAWNAKLSGYYSVLVDNYEFAVEGASKPWSLSALGDDTIRFELRDGEQASWDVNVDHASERSELRMRGTVAPNGTPIHVSYGFMLEPGAANTAKWMVLGQLHQNIGDTVGNSPPFGIYMDGGEHMSVQARYTGADGKEVTLILWKDPVAIERGHEYDFDVNVVFDPTGANGRLVVVRDGVTIVDYSGAIGDAGMTSAYWAQGIYRDSGATETVAARYSHLNIETGAAVTFPDKAAFLGAPSVSIVEVAAAANASAAGTAGRATATASDLYALAVTGTAKAGTIVTVSDGSAVVGTALVDAQGRFALSINAAAGEHDYLAYVTETSGTKGISAPVSVTIATAKEVVAQLAALDADAQLGAIHITDGATLDVGGRADLLRVLGYTHALAAIRGEVTLRSTDKVTGKAYDTETVVYDLHGTMLHQDRLTNGKLTMLAVFAGSTQTTTNWAKDGSSNTIISVSGTITEIKSYDAAGTLKSDQVNHADGGKTLSYYNATGHVTQTSATTGTGLRLVTAYGATGRDYVDQAFAYDSAGKLIAQARFDAKGNMTFATDVARSTTTTIGYGAAGVATTARTTWADGSYQVFTLAADGASVLKVDSYSARGLLLTTATTGTVSGVATINAQLAGVAASTGDTSHHLGLVVAQAPAPVVPAVQPVTGTPAITAALAVASTPGDVVVRGTGTVGASVTVFDGGVAVGTARVAADGSFQVTVKTAAAGWHSFTATARSDGWLGSEASAASSIVIGTAADIAALSTKLLSHGTVSGVYATDLQMSAIKIDGGGRMLFDGLASTKAFLDKSGADATSAMQLRVDEIVSNKAYDHQARTYDANGGELQMQRYAAGVLVQNITTHGAFTVTRNLAADGSSTIIGAVNGAIATSSGYDVAGRLVSYQVDGPDGARTIDRFDASGALTAATTYLADKSRLEWTHNVTGRDYTDQLALRDSGGALTALARWNGAGHLTQISDYGGNTTVTFAYAADGDLASYRVQGVSGYSVTTYDPDGTHVVGTLRYNSKGTLLSRDLSDPAADLRNKIAAAADTVQSDRTGIVSGTSGSDHLTATAGATLLDGGHGDDVLIGGSGNDVLIGGRGADVLTGGAGADLFIFAPADAKTGSAPDLITDFASGDRIDISAYANDIRGHGGFSFVGTASFGGHAGEIRYFEQAGNTFVAADLDGDRTADLVVRLSGHHALLATDFLM